MLKAALGMLLIIFVFGFPGATSLAAIGTPDASRGGRAAQPSHPASRPAPQRPARQAMVININHPSSGAFGRNFPAQHPSQAQPSRRPSYGQAFHAQAQSTFSQASAAQHAPVSRSYSARQGQAPSQNLANLREGSHLQPGLAAVSHHHPYTPGYVRKKLQQIGVTASPNFITDRSEVIHTSRAQSTIPYPTHGPGKSVLAASAVDPHQLNTVMRNQMSLVSNSQWQDKVDVFNQTETKAGHYYWHQDPSGFNYCHYVDHAGYQWYGWYSGNQYLWTRNFYGRWWRYDSSVDRWCFWNNNFWWWQDPDHIGDLYCYNDGSYIPCNSQDDQIAVTLPDPVASQQSYPSPDGTRVVKVVSGTEDAFLYDTTVPPTFDPVYLASGVQTVEFSDTSNGSPLQIILKLNDGSYDMFGSQGGSYGPGAYDADQAQEEAPQATGDSSEAPSETH